MLSAPLLSPGVAVVPGGREVVFFGKPLGSEVAEDHLYALDLNTDTVRLVAPDAARLGADRWVFPLAVTPDGKQVLFNLPAGDLRTRIVAAPMDGSRRLQLIATLTSIPIIMDVGPDGSVYVDQQDQTNEIVRHSPAGSVPERFPLPHGYGDALPLPDGRVVVRTRTSGRDRLMVLTLGGDAKPFLQIEDETTFPVAVLGEDRLAFLQGSGTNRVVAIAMLDGRPERKLTRIKGSVEMLAGSPDGKTLYIFDAEGQSLQVVSLA